MDLNAEKKAACNDSPFFRFEKLKNILEYADLFRQNTVTST